MVTNAMSSSPKVRSVLVLGSSINKIDASGIEKVQSLAEAFRAAGGVLMFSGLKKQVRKRMERAGLLDTLGRENLFPNKDVALEHLLREEREEAARAAEDDAGAPDLSLGGRLRTG